MPLSAIAQSGFNRSIIKALIDHQLAEETDISDESMEHPLSSLPPNTEQHSAIEKITADMRTFAVHLLFGVTGSGKTGVYLQTIAACIERGEQALVLLPEIALTPQTWRVLKHDLMRPCSHSTREWVTLNVTASGLPRGVARPLHFGHALRGLRAASTTRNHYCR